MKIFISQPMRGRTDDEILVERYRAIQNVKAILQTDDIEVIDSLFEDTQDHPLKYLAKSISLLADADVVYFCQGWKSARGCRIEYKAAVEYGIKVIEYSVV